MSQIDASIPLQSRGLGPLKSVSEVHDEVERFKFARESGLALSEQRRAQTAASQQRLAEARAASEQALALRKLTEWTPETLFPIVGPEKGADILKGMSALQEQNFKTEDAKRSIVGSVIGGLKALPPPLRAQMYGPVRQNLIGRGLFKEDDIPAEYTPEYLDVAQQWAMSAKEQVDAARPISGASPLLDPSTLQPLYTPPEKVSPPTSFDAAILAAKRAGNQAEVQQLITLKGQTEAAGRAPSAPRDERIVQVMGPNGSPIWVRESDAVGKPAAQAARAVTGQERNVLAFYNRAEQAAKIVAPLEDTIAKMGLGRQTALQVLPNFLQPEKNQSYRQAQRAFTEARLRKESGAAIPTAEYENDSKTYFAQPGDTAAMLEQKRAARQAVLDGLAFSAGKAYDEYYGAPFQSPNRANDGPKVGETVDLVFDPASGTFKKPGGGS